MADKKTTKKEPQSSRQRGRPSVYTPELIDEIMMLIASGISVRKICERDDMPSGQTFWRWMREKPEFCEQYEKAMYSAAHAIAQEAMDIVDNIEGNPVVVDGQVVCDKSGVPLKIIDSASVSHARLRMDTRKWFASKICPKKYGDKLDVTTGGDKIEIPTRIEIVALK